LVRFEEVVLRYGNGPEILKRVSLQFDPGSYHFLVGASGAGKSSLLRMMYLAQHPSDGRVALFGRGAHSGKEVEELLSWVGLADHMDALPPTLSGGQQQRVAIARAVIGRPSLLLADEPTGNLDDRMAVRLLYLFEELNKIGTTVVIATHNESLVQRFPHPVTRLRDGAVENAEAATPIPPPKLQGGA
jgi:cell division transport system ATP-binding protein